MHDVLNTSPHWRTERFDVTMMLPRSSRLEPAGSREGAVLFCH